MKEVTLSICIPTYNFGRFIGETLSSIIPQAGDDVEIVVLDGGSTDDTTEVVKKFQGDFPRLRYHRKEKRGGIDRDMAETVGIARGEYCWLFSSDDTMEPGAIPKIKGRIREGHDIYLCGLTLCSLDMRPLRRHPVLDAPAGALFDLSIPKERKEYFQRAETTTAFFSFCSSLVFRKSRWDAIPLDEEFVGSCWAHVARFFRMMPQGLTIKYLPEPHLRKRGDNDSFLDRGLAHRLAIGIDGFNHLANTFFGKNSDEAFHIRRVLRNEHSLLGMIGVKSIIYASGKYEELKTLEGLVKKLYGDPSLSNKFRVLAYYGAYGPFLKPSMNFYRYIKKYVPLP